MLDRLASQNNLMIALLVGILGLLACNAGNLLSQVPPTETPTQESQVSQSEPTIASLPSATPTTLAATLALPPTKTVGQATTPPTKPGPASPTSAPKAATSTLAKPTATSSAIAATKTSTPSSQVGCVPNSPQAKPSGIITSVTLGTKSNPTADLVPATVFATNATIHAVVTTQNAPATSIIKAVWYATDIGNAAPCNTLIDQAELTADPNIDFSLTPSSRWPPGTYRVEIYVDGNLDRVVSFSVK